MNENVGRGAALALLTIPAAIVVFAIAGGIFEFWGVAAFVVPPIAAALYTRGAGAPLTSRGWAPFIGINIVAILIGMLAGIIGRTWAAFTTVGGNGGPFGAPFLHQVVNQFRSADTVLPVLIALAVGAIALVSVIRGPRNRVAQPPIPTPGAMPPAAPPASPAAPPVATNPAPPAANQPSPGVMLNGKPVEQDPKNR